MKAVEKKNNNDLSNSKQNPYQKEQREDAITFIEEVISVRRVAKVIRGGRRLVFSAFVVVGDGNGRVGLGTGKAREVAPAVSKAFRRAKKNLILVPLKESTIPFDVSVKFGACKVMMKPARKGSGIIAGGAVRMIMSALGVKDVLSKALGSSNSINVAYATLKALRQLVCVDNVKRNRIANHNQVASVSA